MKSLLLLLSVVSQPACVIAPESLPQDPRQGQAVEAVFVRTGGGDFHDVDPVQARAASFSRVVAIVDAFPWNDRLVELEPVAVRGPVTPAVGEPTLSADIVDSDPLALRNWR
jgi:hypothetical protein